MTNGELEELLLVDPHRNANNHDAVLIDRAVYRAMAQLFRLENQMIERIRGIAKHGTFPKEAAK
jgi:hypothetical protein